MKDLVRVEKQGMYCDAGDFYIDPWQPVKHAVITHGHGDHARTGSQTYYAPPSSVPLLRMRLGNEIVVEPHAYRTQFSLGKTRVSFHPAGHILGSAQVRIEHEGQVWVVSGDYKRTYDPSCEPFEVVPCDVFISEATFALPVYSWEKGIDTGKKIFDWWMSETERPTLLFCYSLGKAQRILAELRNFTDRKVYLHGSAVGLTEIYAQAGVPLVPFQAVSEMPSDFSFKGELILAPPSAHRSVWMKRFKDPQTAFASGWMAVRGARRRRGYEKGFVLSDHADWKELNQTIAETGAKTIFLTHGKTDVLERYLKEKGYQVRLFQTEFESEGEAS